jgi:GT2 family glycosyltransferase/SAM-dependent methyltransferase
VAVNHYRPFEVVHVDLAKGLSPLLKRARGDNRDVYAVLWLAGIPLGHLEVSRSQLERPAPLAHAVARCIAPSVGDRLFRTGSKVPPSGLEAHTTQEVPTLPTLLQTEGPLVKLEAHHVENKPSAANLRVSVVVCTRDRPRQLERCLRSLSELTVAPDEVIVVDNHPASSATRTVVESSPGTVYVGEPNRGLSRARNTGVQSARGDVVAFADDDTVVHPDWLLWLSQAFDDPQVMCVTGLVLPAALDTPAQVAFEKGMGGFSQGYRRIIYDRAFLERTKHYGTPVWKLGAGANMAIRRQAFSAVGGFDERLGAGAAGCSEDSEFWYRVLAEGWVCRYEPCAVVFHHHRSDFDSLRRQARDYVRGHVAALFVQYSRYRHGGNLRRALVAMPLFLIRRTAREFWLPGPRARIHAAHISGYLRGLTYLPLAFRNKASPIVPGRAPTTDCRHGYEAGRREFLRRNPYPRPLSKGFFYREKMRAIHTVAPLGPLGRILEIGGGQSGLTALLYPQSEVVSVDIEPAYARSSLNQITRTRFVCADATSLPFPDASFDAVTMFDVLEHIPRDDEAALEALRVLRPGGFALVSSPNEHWRFPYYRVMQPACPTDQQVMNEWGHVRRGYSIDQLRHLLGATLVARANYITPITAIGHDITFSKLIGKQLLLASVLVSPLMWLGYFLHHPDGPGEERVSCWRRDGG